MDIYGSQAWLYDTAFSWDVEEEIDWLLERLGPGTRSVLEPACGSGRLFPGFAARDIEIGGFDASPDMLDRARARMRERSLPEPLLAVADLADFDLGRRFGGAVCPINTFAYITSHEAALAHLRCVARHLEPGGRYLVQLDLNDLESLGPGEADEHSHWEMDGPRGRVRCTVSRPSFDRAPCIAEELSRYEVLDGPEAGLVHEQIHAMRAWDWASWSALVEASPFRQTAAHDGSRRGAYPTLELGPSVEGSRLTWHVLALTG